ncbi:hypothetical protein K7432_001678 [Basidiobolus ranarum]|uniref:FAS1 domain-containing protein n=1 Tax=Basidiobolus ranarum TaxID=34480 RepID=A0ABR2W9H9_9FUNG
MKGNFLRIWVVGLLIIPLISSQSLSKQSIFPETFKQLKTERKGKGKEDYRCNTLLDWLKKEPRFSKVSNFINTDKSLLKYLNDTKKQTTFFAPTNSAISKFFNENEESPDEERRAPKLRKALLKILKYHIVPGSFSTQTLKDTRVLKTMAKEHDLHGEYQRIRFSYDNQILKINEVVKVKEVDLRTSNGIIHVVQDLLTEPLSIADTLIEHPNKFTALNLALQNTGLNHLLKRNRGLTFLAPSNIAFRSLGCKNLKYLFSPHGEKDLEKIINHHISYKLAYSNDFKHFQYHSLREGNIPEHRELEREHKHKHKHTFRKSLPTLFGDKLRFEVTHAHSKSATLWVNRRSRVLYTDLISRNGVTHVIDRILIPHGLNISNDGWWDDSEYCMNE